MAEHLNTSITLYYINLQF